MIPLKIWAVVVLLLLLVIAFGPGSRHALFNEWRPVTEKRTAK